MILVGTASVTPNGTIELVAPMGFGTARGLRLTNYTPPGSSDGKGAVITIANISGRDQSSEYLFPGVQMVYPSVNASDIPTVSIVSGSMTAAQVAAGLFAEWSTEPTVDFLGTYPASVPFESGGGGGVTLSSPNGTVIIGGTSTAPTLETYPMFWYSGTGYYGSVYTHIPVANITMTSGIVLYIPLPVFQACTIDSIVGSTGAGSFTGAVGLYSSVGNQPAARLTNVAVSGASGQFTTVQSYAATGVPLWIGFYSSASWSVQSHPASSTSPTTLGLFMFNPTTPSTNPQSYCLAQTGQSGLPATAAPNGHTSAAPFLQYHITV